MKKLLFACVFMCVLCFTCVFAENVLYEDIPQNIMMAETGTCNPCMYIRGNRYEEMDGFYPFSTVNHKWRICYHAVCFECGSTSISYDWGASEPHNWEYVSERHCGNTLRHEFKKRCKVCGDTEFDYRDCPGPQNGGCIITLLGAKHENE